MRKSLVTFAPFLIVGTLIFLALCIPKPPGLTPTVTDSFGGKGEQPGQIYEIVRIGESDVQLAYEDEDGEQHVLWMTRDKFDEDFGVLTCRKRGRP